VDLLLLPTYKQAATRARLLRSSTAESCPVVVAKVASTHLPQQVERVPVVLAPAAVRVVRADEVIGRRAAAVLQVIQATAAQAQTPTPTTISLELPGAVVVVVAAAVQPIPAAAVVALGFLVRDVMAPQALEAA
jgi:hypothetical protein